MSAPAAVEFRVGLASCGIANGARPVHEAVEEGPPTELLVIDKDDGVQAEARAIAELVGELVRYEQALTSLITARAETGEASERQHALFQGLHVLHTYLFSRLVPEPADA